MDIVSSGEGGGDGHDSFCEYPLVDTGYEAGCDPHKYHGVHVAHDVLFWSTILILLTFEIELLFLVYLLGPKTFLHEFLYVLDLFIVSASLILELVFLYASNQALEVLPGILILFRVWRFVRIGHGLVASTYEVMEHKLHIALEHIELLEERLRVFDDEAPERPKKLKKSGKMAAMRSSLHGSSRNSSCHHSPES